MDRPLVVTDSSNRVTDLIQEAGDLAENAGVPRLVLTVVTQNEYEDDAAVLETIGEIEGSRYNVEPDEYAEEIAQTAVSDLLSDLEVETETIGRAVQEEDDKADAILSVTESNDCDYIFLLGRRRSPTGKAIFGDIAQSVILNFDGYVVTLTE